MAAVTHTAHLCARLGHHVEEVVPPELDGADLSEAYFTVAGMAMQQVADMMRPLLGRRWVQTNSSRSRWTSSSGKRACQAIVD